MTPTAQEAFDASTTNAVVQEFLLYTTLTSEQPDMLGPNVIKGCGRVDLLRLFRRLRFAAGAEIGVWKGHFSKAICEALPGVQLRCVDPWRTFEDYCEKKNDATKLEAAFAEAQERLRPFKCDVMRMTSLEAAARVPDRSLDFVYIDGNHARAHVLSDLAAWTVKVRRGGIVAGHDYAWEAKRPWIEVVPAVQEFVRGHRIAPWFVLAADKAPSYCWVVS